MGRYYTDKKAIAEDCLRLSIFDLRRQGFLVTRYNGTVTWSTATNKNSVNVRFEPLNSGTRMRLLYHQTNYAGDRQDFNYTVELTTTPCNYGYERYWFICPFVRNGVKCGRRVGVLYKDNGYFGCRHCHNLSYSSRNENAMFRAYPWRVLADDDKREKLQARIKRQYYAGEPTRLYQRLLDLKYTGAQHTGLLTTD